MEEINVFVPLVEDNDYEILTVEPYTIRRISNGFIPKISTETNGYQRIALNCKMHKLHRVLAIQFIPNPDNLPDIDHKNHIKTDNRLENLRWVSASDNMKNLSGHTEPFEYFDDLPVGSQRLDLYNGHDLEEDQAYDYKGIIIDFECTTLKFNNQLVAPIPTPPIENAIKQTNVLNEYKPQFTGATFTIPLNAVMFAQKVIGYPICWNGAIPIDCYIDVDGHVRINTMCQLVLPDDFCVQVCDSYALHNQSS
ncbi:MAG: hypothetical protein EZS28_034671 [Streblomastix strix]|uniref:HNH nuclease domain-containing protein n=1 Tax=Streblomastix strix TaxID=222440 RepID=A0A5J4UIT9_9EUKA|nr:MAG: hypothetical protein EZS28_034671 [Streblomastix strix]